MFLWGFETVQKLQKDTLDKKEGYVMILLGFEFIEIAERYSWEEGRVLILPIGVQTRLLQT